MFIDRENNHTGDAEAYVTYCLDCLEKSKSFREGFSWGAEIVNGLQIEEVVGALVATENRLGRGSIWGEEADDKPGGWWTKRYAETIGYRLGVKATLHEIQKLIRDKRSKAIIIAASKIAGANEDRMDLEVGDDFLQFVIATLQQRMHWAGPQRRFLILRRDGFKCQLCGKGADSGRVLEVDHKVPKARGGTDDDGNLWTLCNECNRGKSDLDLHAEGGNV